MSSPSQAAPDWSGPTELATQLMGAHAEDEAQDADIGKKVSHSLRELFVVCEPGEALRQQFDKLGRPHMAVHGVGAAVASRTLAAIAQTSGWGLKKLAIRRQGFGDVLAGITYLDCPAHDGKLLRLYACDVEGNDAARISVGRLLLGRAGMVAVILDERPGQPMPAVMQALHEDLQSSAAHGRVVLLPQARTEALRSAVDEFKRRLQPGAEVFPGTSQPAQQWALIATAWNRMFHAGNGSTAAGGTQTAVLLRQINIGAPPAARPAARPANEAEPARRAPTPPVAAPAAAPVPQASPAPAAALAPAAPAAPVAPAPEATSLDDPMDRYGQELRSLPGVRGGAVFEMNTLRVLARVNDSFSGDKLAQQGRNLVMAAAQAGPVLGLGAAIGELIVSLGDSQLLVRPVPRHAGVLMHLVVERKTDLAELRQAIKRADLALT